MHSDSLSFSVLLAFASIVKQRDLETGVCSYICVPAREVKFQQ